MMSSETIIKHVDEAGCMRSTGRRCHPFLRRLVVALVCASVGAAYAQTPPQEAAQDNRPVISDMEIHAGPKGLVLLITANDSINIGQSAAELEKATAKYAQLRIKITKVRSGLTANSFDAPADIPIKNIVLKDSPDGGVEFALTMRATVNGPIMIGGQKHEVKILLTKDAQPELRWSASKGLLWSKAAKPLDPAAQGDGDIRVEPPDMKKMEARASKDTNHAPPNKMFTVKEGQTMAVPQKGEIPNALPDEPFDGAADSPGLVRYKIFGRDPFVPLVKDTSNAAELPRVENLRLVGVLEDTRERIALLEDITNSNRAFALRVNDPVEHGKVLRVHRDKVVFIIRDFDVSRSYTLSLTKDTQSGRARGR
jgi:hypothetical protein